MTTSAQSDNSTTNAADERDNAPQERPPAPEPRSDDFSLHVESDTFDELYVRISGSVRFENAAAVRAKLLEIQQAEPLRNLALDLTEVGYFDSAGTAVLMEVRHVCEELNNSFRLAGVSPTVQERIDLVGFHNGETNGILSPRTEPGVLVQMGEGAVALLETSRDILSFIGASVVALAKDVAHPSSMRRDRLWKLIEKHGSDATPIVAALAFLMGAILAFQAAIQLRKFGANIFVADLVSVSICLEMGPLLTALIVAGRSGAGFAAHIGTMQVNEEVDALRVMAIDPIRYLVSPRILAVALAMPCLTLIADAVGVIGGCVVAGIALDLTPTTYFNQVATVLEVSDVAKGVLKGFAFGVEIAIIGCLRGFQVRGGAESVGTATTSAVVTCIAVVVLTDAVFSVLYHYIKFI